MLQNCLRENSLTPFAEKHYSESPYSYCGGNPVNPMDPSGLDWYKTLNDVYACLSPEQMAALHLSEDGTLTSQLTGEVYHYLGPTMTITDARGNVYVGNQNCDVYRVKDVDQNTLTPPVNSGPSRFELTDIKAWKLSIIPNMSSLNRDNYMNINGIMCRYIQIPSLSPLAIPEFKGFVIPEITTEPLPGIDMKVDAIASDATSITTSTPMPNVSYSSEPTAFLSQGPSGGGNGGSSGSSFGTSTSFSTAGAAGYVAGLSKSTFRITNGAYNGSQFSPQIYPGWNGGGVARISTYSISKIGSKVSTGAGIITTAMGYDEIIYGNPTSKTFFDTGVGTVGGINAIMPFIGYKSIATIGEATSIYGLLSLSWDIGFYSGQNWGPSTWYGYDNTKWFK